MVYERNCIANKSRKGGSTRINLGFISNQVHILVLRSTIVLALKLGLLGVLAEMILLNLRGGRLILVMNLRVGRGCRSMMTLREEMLGVVFGEEGGFLDLTDLD